jgi:cytochrome b561
MLQSRTRSTSNAISFPAARSALSETKRFSIGERRLQVHGWAALLLLVLIGLHVGAALRDRFVRHDEALAAGLLSAVRQPHRPGMWELSKWRRDKGDQAR